MNEIVTDGAPRPAGHYAQAIVHNGLVFVSGQLPIRPGQPPGTPGPIAEQTAQAIANVRAILLAAGVDLSHVIKTTVYVSDIALWPDVNAAYARAFGAHRPARSVVPCATLHYGYQVEIEAIAALP